MSDEPLLTLRQVAEELGLPESTARYYRDAFLEHIPSVGTGRRRRYPPPAVAMLRSVAEAYASGRNREQIATSLEGAAPPSAAALPHETPPRSRHRPADVSNLELLAAIVDGEREQRDALWQMAKEIVRLTDVLEGQEKVLGEIAEHAGVQPALGSGAAPPKALGMGGDAARADIAAPASGTASPPQPAWVPAPRSAPAAEPATGVPAWLEPPFAARMPFVSVEPAAVDLAPAPATHAQPESSPVVPAAAPEPAATAAAAGMETSDMERLRGELGRERDLVERLREAKVKLEHRVTDAEAELDEQRRRKRGSVLGRILSSEPKE